MKTPPPNGTLPWTRSCFVCGEENPHGLRLRSRLENGRVLLDYTTRPADVGYRHLVHGGLATTLLDEVMTWAAIIAMQRVCVAAELTVRLKSPIRVGDTLHVAGWVERAAGRLCLAQGEIRSPAGAVLLSAVGKYMPMPPDQAALTEKDFVHSPAALPLRDVLGDPA